MNGKRVLAVAHKEWREIVRDRIFCALAFLMPAMLMVLFGYGMSHDVQDLPFAVVDYDRTDMSRDYVHHFTGSRYFHFKGYVQSTREADRLLADGTIRFLIVIPDHFQEQLLKGEAVQIQTLLDGTFTQTIRTAEGYLEAINGAVNGELQMEYVARHLNVPLERAAVLLQPVRLEVRYLYNQEMRSIWAVAPSLIMLITTLMAPLLAALGVVREKETGAIYNIYSSTVSRAEFLAGKLLPYTLISSINAVILWLIAVYYFRAPFKGSLSFFILATLMYVVCTTGFGLLLSLLVRTQQAALMISVILSFMIVGQFSGIFTPVSSLTGPSYVMAHLFPPMYYNDVVEGVFLKGMGFAALWWDAVVMALFSAAVLVMSYALFRKRTPA
jgi:drug efflux transport system permease protein